MFQKWNAIIVTSLGTFLRIAGSLRESSKGDYKLLLQKKKKNTKATKEDEHRTEYYLISTLSGSIIDSANSWLVDIVVLPDI